MLHFLLQNLGKCYNPNNINCMSKVNILNENTINDEAELEENKRKCGATET